MEDAATAEISRTQIWQWLHNQVPLDDGRSISSEWFKQVLEEEMARIELEVGQERFQTGRFALAKRMFTEIVEQAELEEFLTLKAYAELE